MSKSPCKCWVLLPAGSRCGARLSLQESRKQSATGASWVVTAQLASSSTTWQLHTLGNRDRSYTCISGPSPLHCFSLDILRLQHQHHQHAYQHLVACGAASSAAAVTGKRLAAVSTEADMALDCCCGASSATLTTDAEWLEPGMIALCEAGTDDGAASVTASVSAAPSAPKSAACHKTWSFSSLPPTATKGTHVTENVEYQTSASEAESTVQQNSEECTDCSIWLAFATMSCSLLNIAT